MTINASGLYSSTAFKGKVIGITGAAHGIGRATAYLFAELGASLLLMDVDEWRLGKVETKLRNAGADVLAVRTDVSKLEDLTNAVDGLQKRWGKLYGWMNNAAINEVDNIDEQDEETFVHMWETNLLAAWRSLKLTLPLFEETGGAIVNVSSILASRTRPGNMGYASSKSALEGLSRTMSVELAPRRIRVNCIIPGAIHVQTRPHELEDDVQFITELDRINAEFYEMGSKLGQPWRGGAGPEDVANLAVFLLSNASPYVTGSTVHVDGALNAEMTPSRSNDPSVTPEAKARMEVLRKRREELMAEQKAQEKQAKLSAKA